MSDPRSWWPSGYGDDPAFQVRRQLYGTATGGDYVRGSSVETLAHTALRYPTEPERIAEYATRSVLQVRPQQHGLLMQPILRDGVKIGDRPIPIGTVEIRWGWPGDLDWLDVVLVRSAFGRPSTVNDGVTLYQQNRAFFRIDDTDESNDLPPPIIEDKYLPPGRWYYYGLFFRVSEVDWVRGMVDSCLLPRDFDHDRLLWEGVPPYYRWVDDNQRLGTGHLRQFLSIFGFELDQAREYVESWQHLYDIDWSPMRLLRYLGENFGIPYEQGLGDTRYRSLLNDIGGLYNRRGTTESVRRVIRGASKYLCTITPGAGLSLLADDSDFYTSVGHWAPLHPGVPDPDIPGSPLPFGRVIVAHNDPDVVTPPVGRGSMRIQTTKADATGEVVVTCGAGMRIHNETTGAVTPPEAGVPAQGGKAFGFSVWVFVDDPPINVQLLLMFYGGDGDVSDDLLDVVVSPIESAATRAWHDYVVEGVAPEGAIYVVPGLLFTNRTDAPGTVTLSPFIDVAGVMVYEFEVLGEADITPPNRYLTVGDTGELLGTYLTFRGTYAGAANPLPTSPVPFDAWTLAAPLPTAAPAFSGTPPRAAAVGDVIYWNGTMWLNVGPLSSTFEPFILGAPL